MFSLKMGQKTEKQSELKRTGQILSYVPSLLQIASYGMIAE